MVTYHFRFAIGQQVKIKDTGEKVIVNSVSVSKYGTSYKVKSGSSEYPMEWPEKELEEIF